MIFFGYNLEYVEVKFFESRTNSIKFNLSHEKQQSMELYDGTQFRASL